MMFYMIFFLFIALLPCNQLQMKKNILIVTRNLPPLIGGMERLNWHIADELSHQHHISLISHQAAKATSPTNIAFFAVPLKPLPFFLISSFFRTLYCCITQPIDVLFAGSGLTAPIVVLLAKLFRKKSVIYIHGLDIGTNNKVYNLFWIPFIRHADQVIANSSPTYQLCLQKQIAQTKLSIVHPGVTYPPKAKNEVLIQSLKNKYNLNDKKVLISVGRLTERKGINEFLDHCLPKIISAHPNTVLVIIGDTPSQSLNKNLQSKEMIMATANQHGIEEHVIFTGNISQDEILSSFYYLADLHVFPVKHIPEDPEGFGMVAIEAAAHGTPTVAFATGGVIDAVQNQITGILIDQQNYESLAQAIITALSNPVLEKQECMRYASNFSWKNMGRKISNLIDP
ncbi:glycosyltransferase family 4 protein [Acinetobacter sp. ME22]|uniref:glycosyltransferase family 4 protein n=1 Tax=Acinetobacter sp. ME22 TaxID=2904802 RepID=UPI001EDA302B|nr:glycosyltransferase family 4 protein [Acinetobacter sp. ME22]MCG2573868.1 glycosyltransferase family 4 protein [Acinetobacter sp. ME22]